MALMVIAIITLLSVVVLATYAYFTGTVNVNNKANVTASTERNNMVFDNVVGYVNCEDRIVEDSCYVYSSEAYC